MLDHIVYGAPDLTSGRDALEQCLGVRAGFGGKHSGRGTQNALLDLGGNSYLEIIAPDPEQSPRGPLPFGVRDDMHPHLVGWAVRTQEIDSRARRSRAAGHDPGEVQTMQRRTPDGALLRWRLTRSTSTDFLAPFLIDWDDTPHPSRAAPAGCELIALRAEHPDPDLVARQLRALEVDLPVEQGPSPALTAVLNTPKGRIELR